MRLHRPVLVALALGTVLPVSAASAATGVAAAGSAVSSATLATLSIGDLTVVGKTVDGHTVSLGTLSAVAQTLSGDAPAVSFVPATIDGAKKGEVTVTPANSPKSVGAVAIPALPLNVLSATSPSATLTAAKDAAGPISGLTANLGQASILGMPLKLNGKITVGSSTNASKSQAAKTLTITDVELPNLADLLAALGIDLKKLPIDTLNALVRSLPVTISSTASSAIAATNAAIGTANAAYATAVQNAAGAQTAYNTAAAAFDQALASAIVPVGTELPAGVSAPLDHNDWDAIQAAEGGSTIAGVIAEANTLGNVAQDYDDAQAALANAQTALAAALTTLTTTVAGLTEDLAELVDGVLAGNPLVEIGAAQVGTIASAGTPKAASVTGYVSGVKVLGQDVLKTATGNTKLDVAALSQQVSDKVNDALADVSSQLSSVLSSATGAVGLQVPAPSIKVLTKSASTGTDGAFGTAQAAVSTLEVSLGSVVVPDVYALAGATQLPGILPTSTGFKTAPFSVKVGVLGEAARFRPGSSSTGTTTTPGGKGALPTTGGPAALGVIAVVGTALAFGARRMARSES